MKFGIYSSIANPPRGEDLPRCVDEVIEEARLAEQAGFDSCFFGEHHQDRDGFLPSPLIVCTAVAASTTTLRVGTSVILLPLHHPVRLAEDVVTLDIISKGRVTVGVGLGYQPADFQAFGITMSDRVELFEEPWEGPYSPSIDQVMALIADHFGVQSGAILFSGMGNDGAISAAKLRQMGIEVWAQSAETCANSSQPDSARATGCVSFSGSPRELARKLVEYTSEHYSESLLN